MRKFFLLLLAIPFFIKSQPNFNFAFDLGGNNATTEPYSITKDNAGNIYVCGTFSNTVDFDPSVGAFNLTALGFYDIYLAKYNSGGQLMWAFNLGSAGDDGAYSVMTDASNNVFIAGYMQGACDFDPSPATATLTYNGGYDCFIAKYNSNGQYQWGFSSGSTSDEWNQAALLDASGNIYLTGPFQGTVDFNPAAGVNTLASQGAQDIFLAKYNSSGVYQWALSVGDPNGNESSQTLCEDPSGNICLTGFMQGLCDFDPSPATATLQAYGPQDIFVAKYNSSGQYVWAFNMGSPDINNGRGIKTDASGNIYLTGYFGTTVDFDPSPATATLATPGMNNYDIFVAKYNSSGQYQWAFSMGGGIDDEGTALAIDASNNIYIGGTFLGTVDFDPGPGTSNFTGPGGYDAFIAKYDANGQYQWAFNENSSYFAITSAMYIDAPGNIFVCGDFSGIGDFDPSLAVYNVSSVASNNDAFVAKYSSLCTPLSINFNVNSPSCPNNTDGSATVTAIGGATPYVFNWGPAAGNQTTQVATNLQQGNYNVLVTDNNNCAFNATVAVNALSIPVPSICMVTVDSVGMNNVILWDKNQYAGADSFYVYRDIANNNYQLIGKVAKSNPYGQFIDTLRTLYPANGDPRVSSWKYKIAIKDSCGNLSQKSQYHKTLFIQHSFGNFTWSDYNIEGQAIPVPALNNYVFRRDNLGNGQWQDIQTLSASSTAYTDPNYNTYALTGDWRVETIWNIQCSGGVFRSPQNTINRSKSNLGNNRMINGIHQQFLERNVLVYPNPASDFIQVELPNYNGTFSVSVENTLGQTIFESSDNKLAAKINSSAWLPGFYNIRINSENGFVNKKMIVR